MAQDVDRGTQVWFHHLKKEGLTKTDLGNKLYIRAGPGDREDF